MNYSLPYILLVLFFLLIAAFQLGMPLEKQSRQFLNYILVITYILFFGFRGFVATDWINYYPFFKELPTNLAFALKQNPFEPGFVIYSVLIKTISKEYIFFQFVNTLTNIILLNIFLKRYLSEKYYALGFAVFIVFFGYVFEINLLRNFKSLLIFLLSIKYIENRNWIKYYSFIILALLFHWSSIIFFPLYFFLHKKTSLRTFIIIFVIGTVIYLLQIEYVKPIIKLFAQYLPVDINERISSYLDSKVFGKSYGLTFGYFERTLTTFLILFLYNKITKIKSNILFVNSFLIYLIFYLYFSEVSVLIIRLASIFAYSYWILIPMIIFSLDRNMKWIIALFFGLLLLIKIHLATNTLFYQYDSYLSSNMKSYKQRYEIYEKNKEIIDKK